MILITRDRLKGTACSDGRTAFMKYFPKNLLLPEWTDYHQGLLLAHPVWRTFWGFAARKNIIPRLPIVDLDLSGADFSNADICHADFSHSNLSGANFRNANAFKTLFYKCNLSNADFTGANIKFANFAGAELSGAIFENVVGTKPKGF